MIGLKNKDKKKTRYSNIYPNRYAFVYIGPATILMIGMCLFPVLVLFYNSFTDFSLLRPMTRFIGFRNFERILFRNPDYLQSLGRTVIYASCTVTLQIIIGFSLVLIFQVRMPFRKTTRSIMILPMVASPIAVSFLWTIMLHPTSGVVNYLLEMMHLPTSLWISSSKTALASVIMVDVWKNTPYVFLIFSSAMTAMPHDLFEAAVVDGASFWQMIHRILLPLLKPVFTVVLMLKLVDGLKAFDLLYSMTSGGPVTATQTVNVMIYKSAFVRYEMGLASAQAVILYIIIFAVATFIVRIGGMNFD